MRARPQALSAFTISSMPEEESRPGLPCASTRQRMTDRAEDAPPGKTASACGWCSGKREEDFFFLLRGSPPPLVRVQAALRGLPMTKRANSPSLS